MQSRWRALLACRGLCEPLEAAQFGFCGEQVCTLCKGALELAYARTRCHTRINHLPRRRARSRRSVRQQDLAPGRVMSSMHR